MQFKTNNYFVWIYKPIAICRDPDCEDHGDKHLHVILPWIKFDDYRKEYPNNKNLYTFWTLKLWFIHITKKNTKWSFRYGV